MTRQWLNRKWYLGFVVFCLLGLTKNGHAQSNVEQAILQLDDRVRALEQYVENLPSTLDQQIQYSTGRSIIIDPFSPSYQAINTNSGPFLIATEGIFDREGEYILKLKVGNVNSANFRGFKIRLRWGTPWTPMGMQSFAEWRGSLQGVEFQFQGVLEQGKWNSVELVLPQESRDRLGYVELEMDVNAVEMSAPKQ